MFSDLSALFSRQEMQVTLNEDLGDLQIARQVGM